MDRNDRSEMRLYALGACVQLTRTRRKLSVEKIAEEAGIGHVTWRRVEDGKTVRVATYANLDSYFQLPPGSMQRAAVDDSHLVGLAQLLDIAHAGDTPPDKFVLSLARTHKVGALKYGEIDIRVQGGTASLGMAATGAANVNHAPPEHANRLELVASLATDLAMDPARSDLAEEVRQLLARYLEELAVRQAGDFAR